ncbi:tetratricopeptide repeat protein [Streptomyces sp. NBC_00191]|uniref:tetratricopeptide repeat protein n=1 Tax=Streptomyces sp. NBC_00191 TaxID=2975674 RepID=UPI0038694178
MAQRAGARPSMQELIRRRRRAGFVGRRGELALFRENFDVPVEDERHRFVFHIHGNAGVGKTSLVRELEHTARERHALTATLDESVNSVPEAMAAIGAQFAQQGSPLKALDRMLATYRQRRYEAESATPEPEPAPGGAPPPPSAGSMVAAQAGLVGLGLLPGVGALAGAVEPAQIAQGADRLKALLSARFRNQEDVQLVMDPLRILTPVLIAELERVASDNPWIVLFFDTYERTGTFLDGWLRDLITTERYGTLPANVVVTLAGQGSLDPGCWADYVDIVTDLPLEPFTESEARQLLAAKGVMDEDVVRDVLRISGRLPVLVSTLAENPGTGDDPSATAVERFLKWEPDPARKAAAQLCALPRRVDEDILRAVVEPGPGQSDGSADGVFTWLCALPFVSMRQGRAQYHDVVRGPMLRLQRGSSPRRWSAAHTRLAQTFADRREAAAEGVAPDELWAQESWRGPRLEEWYHRLCAQPRTALPGMLRDGVEACEQGGATARRWARVLAEAGEDADDEEVRRWGRDVLAALEDEQRGDTALLGLLLARAGFGPADQVAALVVRAMLHRFAEQYRSASSDYERALNLDPACARAYYGRAMVLQAAAGDTAGALEDLNRADTHSPDTGWILQERGEVHRQLGHHEEAIADCDRVLAMEPDDERALATRAHAKHLLDRNREALADLDRAIELDQEYLWALIRRSEVRQALGDDAGAVADLDRALEVDPESAWAVGERGDVHRQAGRFEEAIEDLDQALRIDPEYAWALGSRAAARAALGHVDQALADYTQALEIDPDYSWALVRRAGIHHRLGDLEAQFADLDRAVGQGEGTPFALTERGDAHHRAGRYEEALADLDRAIAQRPEYGWAIGLRGQVLLAAKRLPEALTDLERAGELLPKTAWVLAEREDAYDELRGTDELRARCEEVVENTSEAGAWIRRASARTSARRYDEALADWTRALELDPEHGWARVRRAWVRGRLGDQEGFADLDRLVATEKNRGWALAQRARSLTSRGLLRRALADLDQCAAMGYFPAWTQGRRAVVCLYLDRPAAAMEALDSLLPGDRDSELPLVAETLRRLGRFEEARETAERLRTLDAEEGLFHLAMAASRMAGTQQAEGLWRELEEQYTDRAPQAPDAWDLCERLVLSCALGQWGETGRLLERVLAERPVWGELADLKDTLAEFAQCPGADTDRLAELLAGVGTARDALGGAGEG